MRFTVGLRLRSAVDDTQVVVIRASEGDLDVTCGGHALVPVDADPETELTMLPGRNGGTLIGKRYADPASGLELLCTKAGSASLYLGDEPLPLKSAKPLPASD